MWKDPKMGVDISDDQVFTSKPPYHPLKYNYRKGLLMGTPDLEEEFQEAGFLSSLPMRRNWWCQL